jgi:hypothetical protein
VIPEEDVLEGKMDEFEVLDSREFCQAHAAPPIMITVLDAQAPPSMLEKILIPLSENSTPLSFTPKVEEPSLTVPLQPHPMPRKETELRRSVCIKIKDLPDSGVIGTRGYLSSILGNYSLIDNFPFPRLSVDEISDLFRSYWVVLGDTDTHRSLNIDHLR